MEIESFLQTLNFHRKQWKLSVCKKDINQVRMNALLPHVYRFVVHSVRIVCFADNFPLKSLCGKVLFCGLRTRGDASPTHLV